MKVCPHCKESKSLSEFYSRRGKEGNSVYCKQCTAIQTKARQQALKKKAVEYKGGKCQRCGYCKCQAALEFHHLDPLEKEFSLGSQKSSSFQSVKDELDKCALLCSNCHREVHYEDNLAEWKNILSDKDTECTVELDSYQKPVRTDKYPDDEELKMLVWKYPRTHLAKVFGVSSGALGRFLTRRGIKQPPRGYWSKVYYSKQ